MVKPDAVRVFLALVANDMTNLDDNMPKIPDHS